MNLQKADRVPVFPLGLVLLPRMPLPLHIFEERYRQMINHCLEHDTPFGVLLHTGSTVQTVGCLATIDSVINTYDDGRMDILAVGTERFRVRTMREDKSYLEADIEIFHDDPVAFDGKTQIEKLVQTAVIELQEFARISGYTLDPAMLESMDTEALSFLLATTDVFSTEEKQQFLELRSTPDRMIRAGRAIGDRKDRLSMSRQIRTILGIQDDEDITHFFN
ncbi:MAG: LON peptidase substrate-binding domain-containing protein [Alkalispirochaeta sp.]